MVARAAPHHGRKQGRWAHNFLISFLSSCWRRMAMPWEHGRNGSARDGAEEGSRVIQYLPVRRGRSRRTLRQPSCLGERCAAMGPRPGLFPDFALRRSISMAIRVGINGFGRIGRQTLKAILERHSQPHRGRRHQRSHRHRDQRPSLPLRLHLRALRGQGRGRSITTTSRRRQEIKVFPQRDPAQIAWGDVGADIVVESTGFFTDAEKARAHLRRRRQEGDHLRPRQGRGHHHRPRRQRGKYDPARHHIISNASCTTNCLAPVAKVVYDTLRHRARA